MSDISTEAKKILEECDVLKILEGFSNSIYDHLKITPNLHIDLSQYENALEQHQFLLEGKFYFLNAIKLNYQTSDTEKAIDAFINEQRALLNSKIISNECFENTILKIFEWFFYDIDKTFDTVYSYKTEDETIKNEEIVFLLFNFCFKSNVLDTTYNLDILDIRRQTFSRIETLVFNLHQDYILMRKNISDMFVEMMKFNFKISDFIDRVIKNREIDFRRHFVTEFYFIVEHFLSDIKTHFQIETSSRHDKQALLKDVMHFFDIKDEIILKDFFNTVDQRCDETNKNTRLLFINSIASKKAYTHFNKLLINRRNCLHSNGIASNNEQQFTIGKVKFLSIEKGEFINSMSIANLITLALIELDVLEKIIHKTIEKDNNIIEDKYTKDYQEFIKEFNKYEETNNLP